MVLVLLIGLLGHQLPSQGAWGNKLVPKWNATYNMSESTVVMPCNCKNECTLLPPADSCPLIAIAIALCFLPLILAHS